jgi:hypothetical protein
MTVSTTRASQRFVSAYVYECAAVGGRIAGYQVRFKRRRSGHTQTLSAYFSLASLGSRRIARAAALAWRNRNAMWVVDVDFVARKYVKGRRSGLTCDRAVREKKPL